MNAEKMLLPALLVLGGIGIVIYASQPGNNSGSTYIPAGGKWGGYRNNNNTGVWLNATGQIIDELGKIIGNITDIIKATNSNDNEWTEAEWDQWLNDDEYWNSISGSYRQPNLNPANSLGFGDVSVIEMAQRAATASLK